MEIQKENEDLESERGEREGEDNKREKNNEKIKN